MKTLYIIKIGGNIIDSEMGLGNFLESFTKIEGLKILVHGGGKLATEMSGKLQIPTHMIRGRRITDAETLKVATMVYAGWVNKNIVAKLQSRNCNAIGLSGADGKCIPAKKRTVIDIDYGFVGDILEDKINTDFFQNILEHGITPVMSSITCDASGQLLNINADTIASALSIALSEFYAIKLIYCFEKKGVLSNKEDEGSALPKMNFEQYEKLKANDIVAEGMIPKLDNAFRAKLEGASDVIIGHAEDLLTITNTKEHAGTHIQN